MSERDAFDCVIARDLRVPMRDGVRLATDLYQPSRDGEALPGPWPGLLVRTPYGKEERPAASATFFARHGYLVAVQDCRGRYGSEGRFVPFVDEPEDGYDAVQWLAAHPRCDGQVGMYGGSHLAWVQFHAATQAPPALKTIVPHYGATNAFHHSMREGGALHLWWLGWLRWLAGQGSHTAREAPHLGRVMESEPLLPWLTSLPWRRGQSPLRLVPEYEDALFRMIEEDAYGEFWRQPGLAMDERFADFPEIPILWIGGWYDYYPHAISDSFARFVGLGRRDQYLLMGPWDHSGFGPASGDVWFGEAAAVDLQQVQLAWFDHWLKGEGALPFRGPVRVFTMGDGEGATGRRHESGRLIHGGTWRECAGWPPPEAEARRYYLQPDGALAPEPPTATAAATVYTYDPNDPVPSVGWCYVSDVASGYAVLPGPRDLVQPAPLLGRGQVGAPLAARRDVLVFTSAPLAAELCVVGPVEARLWIASDAPDTDFTARLSDLYPPSADTPTGYALPVSEGILRARYRTSMSDPRPLVPGEATEIRITLSPTANCFRAGHRLRLDISSSNFPRFEPNRNTWSPGTPPGADRRARAAENRVYHDAARPSSLLLRVLPKTDLQIRP
jgi:putative CocE/NonD family hydrolase